MTLATVWQRWCARPGAGADAVPRRPPVLALFAVAALAASAWQGGGVGVVGALAAAAVLWWVLSQRAASGDAQGALPETPEALPQASTDYIDPERDHGPGVMLRQVVPVWSRQLLVTRTAGDDGMGQLLGAFASISETLDQLTRQLESFQPSAEPGALASAIAEQRPALDALVTPMTRAFAQRDALVSQLGDCATAVGRLQRLSKEAREVGRHTRLVAFNASIEANRGQRGPVAGHHDGGSQQVAAEVRTLAERITSLCDQMDEHLGVMATATTQGHRDGLLNDTTPDELALEIELRARQALEAMMASLGAAMQGSAEVHQTGAALRGQLDEAFTHFQFGDRLAQMLQIIGDDMAAFAEWSAAHPASTLADAQAWLAALEKKYTMDEQRAEHHGVQNVDRGTEVEFF